jgi:hypothetical protein
LLILALTVLKIPPIFRYQRTATGNRIMGIATIIAIKICQFIMLLFNALLFGSASSFGHIPEGSSWSQDNRYGYKECYNNL